MNLTIGWLYPKTMNLYGDRGNIIALVYRAKKRNIEVKIKEFEIDEKFDINDIDLLFFGGGQDKEQFAVARDLEKKKQEIKKFYNQNKPMLAICGGYQLLGKYFKTKDGKIIKGTDILNLYTVGSDKRMIGNVEIKTNFLKNTLTGFENHSGQTFLGNKEDNLGKVVKGFGNNGEDGLEGIKSNNFIGTYFHGPILPKNPELADWLLEKALKIKYNKQIKLNKLDDALENKAHSEAI